MWAITYCPVTFQLFAFAYANAMGRSQANAPPHVTSRCKAFKQKAPATGKMTKVRAPLAPANDQTNDCQFDNHNPNTKRKRTNGLDIVRNSKQR